MTKHDVDLVMTEFAAICTKYALTCASYTEDCEIEEKEIKDALWDQLFEAGAATFKMQMDLYEKGLKK